jgi:hypothetical protein
VPTIIATRLLRGALALSVLGVVLVAATALSSFGSDPPASPMAWTYLGSKSDDSFVAHLELDTCGEPWVRPAEVDYEPDRIVVTIRVDDTVTRRGSGADIIRCTAEVHLDQPVEGRSIVDGSCLDPDEADVPFCRDGAQRWPRT